MASRRAKLQNVYHASAHKNVLNIYTSAHNNSLSGCNNKSGAYKNK